MNNNLSAEFQVNSEMSIKNSLDIISENLDFSLPENIQYIYSERNKKMVGVEYTYQQLGIYSGDKLIVREE